MDEKTQIKGGDNMAALVKIKTYNELKNAPWFVDDMKHFCGKVTEIVCIIDDNFVILSECKDWQWKIDSFTYDK